MRFGLFGGTVSRRGGPETDHAAYRAPSYAVDYLTMKPSEYFHRNFTITFEDDEIGARTRHEIGLKNLAWGNDYPHYEGTFPYNLESLRLTFTEVPEDQRRLLFGLNAAELYKFDLDKLRPLAQKYGPTPEQVNSPLPKDDIPRDSSCYLFMNALYNQ